MHEGGKAESGLVQWKIFRLFCIANPHFWSYTQGFSLIDPLEVHSLPFNMSDYGGDNDAEEKYAFFTNWSFWRPRERPF
jgi:hypothetical protein